MKMNKQTILIPVDGSGFSRQIFSSIRKFFAPEGTELILFEAIDPIARSTPDADIVTASEMLASAMLSGGAGYSERQAENEKRQYQSGQAIQHQYEEALRANAKGLEDAGYAVKPQIVFGEPAEEIIAFAKRGNVDLIAMVTHGRSGVSKLVMGSVAEKVLQESTVPVMMLRPSS